MVTIGVVVSSFCVYGDELVVKQVKRGNFLLPTSQQPSALFSLGQNVVDKGDTLAFLGFNPFTGPNIHSWILATNFLYGINDKTAILVGAPVAFFKNDTCHTAGLADIYAHLEYVFYAYNRPTSTHQASILGGIYAPTGSTKKTPVLGTGACSFLLGATYSYYSPDWLYFLACGGIIATKGQALRAGSTFLYQGGFGGNITTRPGWIFAWVIEVDGTYVTRDRWCGVTDTNSGSNQVYLIPSLWVSSEHFILQAGIIFIPAQHLFGIQNRYEIGGLITLGWKFNG